MNRGDDNSLPRNNVARYTGGYWQYGEIWGGGGSVAPSLL